MREIIAEIFVGIVIVISLYPYFSNIAKAIGELTKEVKELRKTIAERSEE